MNKELRGKLLKIDKDFEDYYGADWGNLYYNDIAAVDMVMLVSLFIDNVKDFMMAETVIKVIKKVFDNKEPIGLMFAVVYCKAIMGDRLSKGGDAYDLI